MSEFTNSPSPTRFLRPAEVEALIGVVAVTIYRWQKKGQFPEYHKLGERVVGLPENEYIEWCASRRPSL